MKNSKLNSKIENSKIETSKKAAIKKENNNPFSIRYDAGFYYESSNYGVTEIAYPAEGRENLVNLLFQLLQFHTTNIKEAKKIITCLVAEKLFFNPKNIDFAKKELAKNKAFEYKELGQFSEADLEWSKGLSVYPYIETLDFTLEIPIGDWISLKYSNKKYDIYGVVYSNTPTVSVVGLNGNHIQLIEIFEDTSYTDISDISLHLTKEISEKLATLKNDLIAIATESKGKAQKAQTAKAEKAEKEHDKIEHLVETFAKKLAFLDGITTLSEFSTAYKAATSKDSGSLTKEKIFALQNRAKIVKDSLILSQEAKFAENPAKFLETFTENKHYFSKEFTEKVNSYVKSLEAPAKTEKIEKIETPKIEKIELPKKISSFEEATVREEKKTLSNHKATLKDAKAKAKKELA